MTYTPYDDSKYFNRVKAAAEVRAEEQTTPVKREILRLLTVVLDRDPKFAKQRGFYSGQIYRVLKKGFKLPLCERTVRIYLNRLEADGSLESKQITLEGRGRTRFWRLKHG